MELLWSSINNKNGKLKSKEEAIKYINNSKKDIKHTSGFTWRNPTTYKEPIEKEFAINLIKNSNLIDIEETDNFIHLNTFSSSDMW